ncbi:MAG: sugar isomerase [Phycisphaerae bacterium]|nr:sugar isomerase [Phycisphaerae bacterium]
MATDCGSHGGHSGGCSCCSSGLQAAIQAAKRAGVSRRNLLVGAGTVAVGSWAIAARAAQAQQAAAAGEPKFIPANELVVQPVLTYAVPKRGNQTSWRPWGGIQTQAQADEEAARIEQELRQMADSTRLAIKFLPVAKVQSKEQASNVAKTKCDVMLIYAAGGGREWLEPLTSKDRPTLYFLRHRSGPVSLYYEILHPHFLRKATDQYADTGIDVNDVVVDEYADLAWRMRALLALRKTLGTRIVAIGGVGGWGAGGTLAPPIAREKWRLDIRTVSYPDVAKRLESLKKDEKVVADARSQAAEYLAQPNTVLKCDKKYVENAFVLYKAFKDMMKEHDCTAMTIQHCMGTIMPISETTACLPLSLINDEGWLAFCESDFVVIPSGILMHNITGLPVFLNDPTWPHHGVVTIAHCTAPRRMDGKNDEPVEIHTHFESDYGAAPKVAMKVGQMTTNVVPDFECKKWVGALGTVEANPFHDICRSQTDIAIKGSWQKLLEDMRGFHWMTCYTDCMKEVGYAIKHLGIGWEDVSA